MQLGSFREHKGLDNIIIHYIRPHEIGTDSNAIIPLYYVMWLEEQSFNFCFMNDWTPLAGMC